MFQCQDCDHLFTGGHENDPDLGVGVQCPQCRSYRTQPSPTHPDMDDSMLLRSMPTSTQDDMSGNPLQEGILADGGWKNRQKRDESFASVQSSDEGLPWYAGRPEMDCQHCGYMGTHWIKGSEFKDGNPGNDTWYCSNCTRPQMPNFEEWPTADHPLGPHTGTLDHIEVPAETTGLALPGQHTIEVPVYPPGLHGDVVGALRNLGTHVNGQEITPDYAQELMSDWSDAMPAPGSVWDTNIGQPIMLSHPDEQALDVAKRVIESGNSTPFRQYTRARETAHQAHIQMPKGITNNLHAALGNLHAWVENPHENGTLRPYYNKYWKSIRPQFESPGAIQIGVQDPRMAEVINHVAQTDDLTPLYEYRGLKKTAGPAAPLLALAPEALAAGGAEAGGAAAAGAGAAEAGGAAAGAGAEGAGASGVGGMMQGAMSAGQGMLSNPMGAAKNMLMGQGLKEMLPGGGDQGGGGTTPAAPQGGTAVQPPSFYGHTADYESPISHPEIPKNEDGDTNQKNDDSSEDWQKDYQTNDEGGTDSGPQFSSGGAGLERFMMLLPLVMHYFNSEEDGGHDPLMQGLDQSLEQEIPGYKDHGDPDAANRLIMMIMGDGKGGDEGEDVSNEHDTPHADETTTDQNYNGEREASLDERVSFLPSLPTLQPSGLSQVPASPNSPTMRGHCPHCGAITDPANQTCPQCGAALVGMPQHQMTSHAPYGTAEGIVPGPVGEGEEDLQSSNWPTSDFEQCPHCSAYTKMQLGMCPHCGQEVYPHGPGQAMALQHAAAGQGPHTPEQQAAVAQLLLDTGRQDEVPIMLVQPEQYANELAQIQSRDNPPPADEQGGPPEPAQEEAPPGATMPVPGMSVDQQMTSAVQRYAADAVTPKCPKCDSHTTGVTSEEGDCRCSTCGHTWSEKVEKTAEHHHHEEPGHNTPGIPAADQIQPEDHRAEQDTSHTWIDSDGNPLIVGQQYEMYSNKYDIPDIVRVEQVKPDAITYTITGELGLDHATEISHEEANLEGLSFVPSPEDAEVGPSDDIENNNDDNTSYEGSPEMTDMSTPHQLTGSTKPGNTELSWLMEGVPKTAGAHYTPMEQRELIDEVGQARNSDLLNLAGTHYDDADDDQYLFGI